MTTAQHSVLEKVRKLFALAEGAGGNENEMELAASRARELMVTYNIEMADIAKKEGKEDQAIKIVGVCSEAWKRKNRSMNSFEKILVWGVGALTETAPMLHRNRYGLCQIRFYGDEPDASLAADVFASILKGMHKKVRSVYGSRWTSTHRSYCDGYCARIAQRCKNQPNLSRPQLQTFALIVRRKKDAIGEHFKKQGLNPEGKKSKRGTRRTMDHMAYDAGWTDGGAVNINQKGTIGEGRKG
jgi:hypothetical protein